MTFGADVYRQQGFGSSSGFGERPALLVVDFVNGFNDPALFGGGNIPAAIANTKRLLSFARARSFPVCFTRVVYAKDGSDRGVFCLKAPKLAILTPDAHATQIVDDLAPVEGEYVLDKTQPSAFFGTGLVNWLISRNVDTTIVTGCTTSGCVRATVVDSMSYNFRTVVVSDGVGDRAIEPHEANLFDMQQKYADLLSADEIMLRLDEILAARP